MAEVALVTGGSSGIGLATCRALLRAGYRVYEMSRRPADTENIIHLPGDVTKPEDARRVVGQILDAEGRLDLLINNAGFGISGAVEFTDTADAHRQFEVNFFGMTNLCQAVLPHMRAAGRGRIINLSSVAAAIPIPFQTYYSASKAAINAYTLALGNELRPYGVSVCALQPGDICTGFTAARKKEILGDEAYHGRISRSVGRMERDEQRGMSPEAVAKMLLRLAKKRRVKPLYSLRLDYRLFVVLSRLLPVRLLNWVVYLLYAR
ncbi:MAG: SDR family oxidoreductase [Oscillospiraceae bacterium]|nr:SDR family oxidoreductase [Oscillospiraceae bacterium]